MEKIEHLSELLKNNILEILYKDEVMNLFLIHILENQALKMGELYIRMLEQEIVSIVHIKPDGNSNFTTYFVINEEYLVDIAELLQKLDYEGIMLAGKSEEIRQILNYMNQNKELYIDCYYLFNNDISVNIEISERCSLKKIKKEKEDIKLLSKYLVRFFQAKDPESIKRITDISKLEEIIENDAYFLEVNHQVVGMARFYGFSKKYIDITTLYISEDSRGNGYGTELIKLMIKKALSKERIPILQASKKNMKACHIYEKVGFNEICEYSFQAI
ncbi:MAG TPA: GNAT family N-acetyltransferase [Clostridia bacterium]|nr:GNAT family N-acetyltransferase [Clostridia bacterium]